MDEFASHPAERRAATLSIAHSLARAREGAEKIELSSFLGDLAMDLQDLYDPTARLLRLCPYGERAYLRMASLRYRDSGGVSLEEVRKSMQESLGMVLIGTLANQIEARVSASEGEGAAEIAIELGPHGDQEP